MAQFRVSEIHQDADLTVLVVESFEIHQTRTKNACSLFVQCEPVAVVVSCKGDTQAFDMQGQSIDFDELTQKISQLRQQLPDQ